MARHRASRMVAGEASGDLLGARAASRRCKRSAGRSCEFAGIGGPQMAAAGLRVAWWPMDKLAVRGYVEVLRHYREIVGIRARLRERLLRRAARPLHRRRRARLQPRPGGASCKAAGIQTVHFVEPVDLGVARRAHREDRARRRPHAVHLSVRGGDLREGRRAGHLRRPSAGRRDPARAATDEARARAAPAARRQAGRRAAARQPPLRDRVHGAAPSCSRRSAAARRSTTCISSARSCRARRATSSSARCTSMQRTDLPLKLLFGHSHEALAAGDVALVASGTATLEAALFKRPMVIAYRQSPLTWALMRADALPALGRHCRTSSPASGWCRSCCRTRRRPATSPAHCSTLATRHRVARRQVERFREFHQLLRRNAAQRAADAVLEVLAGARGLACSFAGSTRPGAARSPARCSPPR